VREINHSSSSFIYHLPSSLSLFSSLLAYLISSLSFFHFISFSFSDIRYARGILNLGISQSNLSFYDLASQSYLKSLILSPSATHIWNYLRVSLGGMERHDLVEKTKFCDVELFFEDFDDLYV